MGKTLVNLVGQIDLPDDCLDLIFGFLGTKCTLCGQMPFISVNLEDRFQGFVPKSQAPSVDEVV